MKNLQRNSAIYKRSSYIEVINFHISLKKLINVLLLVLFFTSQIHGKVNAADNTYQQIIESKAIRSENNATMNFGFLSKNPPSMQIESENRSPLLLEESLVHCPSGEGYCYTSDSGYFHVENYNNTVYPERILAPGGEVCCGEFTDVGTNSTEIEESWVVYDLGEVFEITKFISSEDRKGPWWLEYSEDGGAWTAFGSGEANDQGCTENLYDVSPSPVNVRYIRFATTTLKRDMWVWGHYQIGWFSFRSNNPSALHPPLHPQSQLSGRKPKNGNGDPRECNVGLSICSDTYGKAGDPVNTLTGSLDYTVEDFSISSVVGPLVLQRSYSSDALNLDLYTPRIDTSLGYGWTHNHDIRLVLPSPDSDIVWFKAQSANQYQFTINPDGTYRPYPGVLASLYFDTALNQYSLIDSAKNVYIFDDEGRIQSWTNSVGHQLTYSYEGDLLKEVSASGLPASSLPPSVKQRKLVFNYEGGLLFSVQDHTERVIATYDYDDNDDLISYIDVLGTNWQYTYDANHRLLTVTRTAASTPNETITELRNLYDSNGRVVCQQEGDEHPALTTFAPVIDNYGHVLDAVGCRAADASITVATSISYNELSGITIVKDANRNSSYHSYNKNLGTLSSEKNPIQNEPPTSIILDENFRPSSITNPAGHQLQMTWSSDGANLTAVTDPEGNITTNEYDANNNLIESIDPTGTVTINTYFGRLLTSTTTDPDGLNQTTTYTYTTQGEMNSRNQPQPAGLLKTVTVPGHTAPGYRTTQYEYDSLGQKISTTDAHNRTTRYTYDDLGRLIYTVDPFQVVTHNEYNEAGWLIKTTRNYDSNALQNQQDIYGNFYNIVTEYEYDALGHQVLVRDTLGHETTYTYDKNGWLKTTTNAVGQTTTNFYDNTGILIKSLSAEEGNYTQYYYDAAGRQIKTLDPYEHGTHFTYDVISNSTTASNADNVTVTYYNRNNRVKRVEKILEGQTLLVSKTTYDKNGNVATKTDSQGHVTQYEYDALNRVTRQKQNYNADHPEQNYLNQYNLITNYEYTYNDQTGSQVTKEIDTINRVTVTEYDEYGRLKRQTRNYNSEFPQNGLGQYNIVTEYGYDEKGNQNQVTDTYGRVTYSEFDHLGWLVRQTQNYHPNPNLGEEDLYNFLITENQYDALGRITQKKENVKKHQPNNYLNQYNIVTSYAYDELGRQYKITDTYGRVTLNEYDAAGRVIKTTRNYDEERLQNEENLYNIVTQYKYNYAGQLIKEIDTYGIETYYEYDALGRKVSKTENYETDPIPSQADPDQYNIVTRYEYDLTGHQTDEINPNGVVTHFEYNTHDQLIASVQNYKHGATPTADINVRIEYTYDALGNKITRKDPRGNTTTYAYTALGQLASETTPLQHSRVYTYDQAGRLSKKTDGNAKETIYTYDALGHPLLIDLPDAEADISFEYGAQGQRISMTDGTGTTLWTYDSLLRIRFITNPDGSKVEYTYDALGNCLSVTTHINAADVTGKKVTYTYDALGRKTSVTDWQGQQTIFRYDAMGRLLEVHRPNGLLSAYSYNSAGRLVTLVHSKSGANLTIYEYSYDAVGNQTSAKEKINPPHILVLPLIVNEKSGESGALSAGVQLEEEQLIPLDAYPAPLSIDEQEGAEEPSQESSSLLDTGYPGPGETTSFPPAQGKPNPVEVETSYTYDALNRMTSARSTDGTVFRYTYDSAGNTLQMVKTIGGHSSTVTYTFDADNQNVISQENSGIVWQYKFDENGNLIETLPGSQVSNGAKRYSYNSAGQLTRVETHNGTSYQTNAEMVYNGLGQRLAMTASQAGQSLTSHYVLDGNALLAATANGQSTYYLPGLAEYKAAWAYYLPDGQQSVRQITNASGLVILNRRFTPWGEVYSQDGSTYQTFGYLGGMLDAATGLIYVGNGQYYDPATGRFLSRGVNPGSTNPYVPWQGNPLGMMLGPLALMVLVRGKRKGGKIEQFLVVLIVAFAVSMTVSSCTGGGDSTPPPPTQPSPTPTVPLPTQPGGGVGEATETPTENPNTAADCPPVSTPTPTAAKNGYDGKKAAQFAYDFRSISKFRDSGYKTYPSDCTNFVSYALKDGGLLETDTWKPETLAWINTDALFEYLKTQGFTVSPEEFINTPNIVTKDERDYLQLRENNEHTQTNIQVVDNLWSEFISKNGNVEAGDLVFILDPTDYSGNWSHVAIVTGKGAETTYDSQISNGIDEPLVVDHSGREVITPDKLPRSLGDTSSTGIYKVVFVQAP